MAQLSDIQAELRSLSATDRKHVLITSAEELSPAERSEVTNALGGPTQSVTDAIWMRVVSGFVVVFVGAFVAIALYLYVGKQAEMMLTVFTTVAAFLAGLLAPSPVSASRS